MNMRARIDLSNRNFTFGHIVIYDATFFFLSFSQFLSSFYFIAKVKGRIFIFILQKGTDVAILDHVLRHSPLRKRCSFSEMRMCR